MKLAQLTIPYKMKPSHSRINRGRMKLLGKFPRPKQLIGLQFKSFVSFKGPALVEEPKSGPVTLPIKLQPQPSCFQAEEEPTYAFCSP